MDPRKDIDARAVGLMLLICGVWGVQQVLMKVTAPDVPPIFQVALRTGLASVPVMLLIRLRGGRIIPEGTLRPGLVLGALYAAEFVFIAEGLLLTSASRIVIFIYTAPIFAALGLHLRLPEERLRLLQWLGVALAFGGIVLAFYGGADASGAYPDMLLGDIYGLIGGLFWGLSTVLIRCTALAYAPPANTLLYHLLGGFFILTPAALLTGQARFAPSLLAVGSVSFQAVAIAFASFMIWVWLLRNYLASPLGVLSFMTPIFGVLFGVWLLDEPLEPGFVPGALMVLLGIASVSGYKWFEHALHRKRRDYWKKPGS